MLQHSAAHYHTLCCLLQAVMTHCNTLQHTHCNTPAIPNQTSLRMCNKNSPSPRSFTLQQRRLAYPLRVEFFLKTDHGYPKAQGLVHPGKHWKSPSLEQTSVYWNKTTVLPFVTSCCNMVQRVAISFSVLQHVAVCPDPSSCSAIGRRIHNLLPISLCAHDLLPALLRLLRILSGRYVYIYILRCSMLQYVATHFLAAQSDRKDYL